MNREGRVLILGAGVAGSAAALALARSGIAAMLLDSGEDRDERPFETVGNETVASARALGVAAARLDEAASPCRWIDECGAPAGEGVHLDRALFDAALREAAAEAGAQVVVGMALRPLFESGRVAGAVLQSGDVLEADLVIDATGRRGWLRQALGLRRKRLSPPLILSHGEVRGAAGRIEPGTARFLLTRCGWSLFAARGDRIAWTSTGMIGRPEMLSGLTTVHPPRAWDGTWQLVRPVAGPGWLIAGEAGGRLDPAWGAGVSFVMRSAAEAVRTVEALARAPDQAALAEAAYDTWFAETIVDGAAALRKRYQPSGYGLAALTPEPVFAT